MGHRNLVIGDVQVVSITDAKLKFPIPLSQLFPNVHVSAWGPYQKQFPWLFSGRDTWVNHYICFLIRSRGKNILVDTGIGSKNTNPGMVKKIAGGSDGRLMAALGDAGVRPEDIDIVFLTHLHPDHVGWNLTKIGTELRPTFNRARYIVHKSDWAEFKKPEVQALFPFAYWEETIAPLEQLRAIDFIDGKHSLTNEIVAIPTPGHSPGHMSLVITSKKERALILSDVAIHPVQVSETGWSNIFDMDQQLAIETRKKVLDQAEIEKSIVIAGHFPEPGFGKLAYNGDQRYWQALL